MPPRLDSKLSKYRQKRDFDVTSEPGPAVQVLSGRSVTRGPTRKGVSQAQPRAAALLEKVWPPMLATLSEPRAAPADTFVYEVKYDGYRALAALAHGRVDVRSRNQLDFLARFPFLAQAFSSITVASAVLGGEILARDAGETARFQLMGDPGATHEFVAFDLLWLDGEDLRARPLEERRQLLESVLANARPPLFLAQRVAGDAAEAMATAAAHGWEGLIAKRRGSPYLGTRSTDWLKLKRLDTAELAIVGWTPHSTGRDAVGALLLGVYEADHFVFAGKVGTGFDEKTRARLLEQLSKDEVPTSHVEGAPRLRKAHWVKPKLVAQVQFSEWTRDGKLRHPSFLGLREDKAPTDARRELPASRPGAEAVEPPRGLFGTAQPGGFGTWHSAPRRR